MMEQIRTIEYGTKEYEDTLALRNKVMRVPLGLDIYQEDFSCEKNAIIIGMFDEQNLVGVGVMSYDHTSYKVEYLCVDSDIQSHGLGGRLLEQLESIARKKAQRKFLWMRVYPPKIFICAMVIMKLEMFFYWTLHR